MTNFLKMFLKELFSSKKSERGFSLMEIMIAIAILAVVMGGVGIGLMNQLKKGKIKTARMDITTISNALDLYKSEFGKYPDGETGLEVLVKEKILKDSSVPKDPWRNEYVYIYPGTNNEDGFDLYSFGDDGKEGGGDDIKNWDESEE